MANRTDSPRILAYKHLEQAKQDPAFSPYLYPFSPFAPSPPLNGPLGSQKLLPLNDTRLLASQDSDRAK